MLRDNYGESIPDSFEHGDPRSYSLIRIEMLDALRRYLFEGSPPGDFLSAVLSNDLREAVGRADDDNIRAIPAYIALLYNEAPGTAWGSPENVSAWLKVWLKIHLKVAE